MRLIELHPVYQFKKIFLRPEGVAKMRRSDRGTARTVLIGGPGARAVEDHSAARAVRA